MHYYINFHTNYSNFSTHPRCWEWKFLVCTINELEAKRVWYHGVTQNCFVFLHFFFFTLDWKGLQLSNIRECDVNNTPLTVCSVLVHDNDMYPNLCKFWSKSFHDINPVFMISLLFSWYHSCLLYVQCSYYEKVQLKMLLFSKTIHAVGWMENVTKIIRISLYWVTKKKRFSLDYLV